MSSFRRALFRWVERMHREPAGVEALFVEPPTIVSSLDPSEVGRQGQFGAAILDTAAWLECSGWEDVGAGERQIYAAWLLERRANYERQGALL